MKTARPRILLVPNAIFSPPYIDELQEREDAGELPRSWVHQLNAEVTYLDQRLLTNPPRWLRVVYKRLPIWVVQVLEVYRVGKRYDAVFFWSVANVALILALLLKLSFRNLTLVALFTRVSEPKKARLLKLVHDRFTAIILPPVTQREFAIHELGLPAEKLVDLPWTTDIRFWNVPEGERQQEMICAAGGEMRDYATLVRAMEGLDVPCHIAGALHSTRQDWWNSSETGEAERRSIPGNVTFGTMSPTELRDLYARSRFVIVPLKPTTSDNGITCMNEAWSMGLPVIVSQVEGQRDAFQEGREGLWVPQGDVEALRSAISKLWEHPEESQSMGLAGRELVEREKDIQVFVDGLNRVIAESVGGAVLSHQSE